MMFSWERRRPSPRAIDAILNADFSTQHKCNLPGLLDRPGLRRGSPVLGAGTAPALALHHLRGSEKIAAGALQPPAPRDRTWHRLPLLPHFGGTVEFRGHSAHQDLHELPLANLDQRSDA